MRLSSLVAIQQKPGGFDIITGPGSPVGDVLCNVDRHAPTELILRQVGPGFALSKRRAFEKTARSIGWVSLPVKVFCWLG